MKVNICDKWDSSWLGTGPPVEIDPDEGFSYRALMRYDQIIKHYGRINGVCMKGNDERYQESWRR